MTTQRFKQFINRSIFISSIAGVLIAVGGQSAQAESLQVSPQSDQADIPAAINAETVQPPSPAETDAISLQAAPEAPQTPSPAAIDSNAGNLNGNPNINFSNLNVAQDTAQTDTAQIDTAQTDTAQTDIAQTDIAQEIAPGRATRSGSSYIGIGGNIGFGGDSGLGTGNFAVISKVGLTRNLSLRPAALVGDGATFLVPVTVDFPIAVTTSVGEDRIGLAPFIGGGVAIPTDGDDSVQPLITAGVDVPISSQFTANASANVSFPDDAEVGIILGIGYNFR